MKKLEVLIIIVVLVGVSLLFFHQTFFKGLIPFPGDLLTAEYQPWRSTSYLGYNPGSYPHKAQYPDTLRQLYPWRTLAISIMKEGRLPLWNPYNFSGHPLLANFQTAAFYPLNVVYFIFSKINAWTILVILQPLLAVLFCYLYSRAVGLSILASLFAGISYGFSSFMSVWLEYNTVGQVVLWLPLLLLAVEQLTSKNSLFWIITFSSVVATTILAGHPQVAAYLLVFVLCYLVFRVRNLMRRIFIGSLILIGIGLAGVQLIPGLELIFNAARSSYEFRTLFDKILIQPWQLLMLPFPNFFGNPATRSYWPADTFVGKVTSIGFIPLFFLLASWRRKKEAVTRFYMITAAVILVLVTANPFTYFLYKLPLPFLSSSSPTLMVFLLTFSLAIVAGLGLDSWMKEKHSIKKLVTRGFEVGLTLFGLWLVTRLPIFPDLVKHSRVAERALIYAGTISVAILMLFWVAIRFPKLMKATIIILLFLHTADLFIFFKRFNPFVPRQFVFPDHQVLTYLKAKAPDRYWGYGTASIEANFASFYRIFSPDGYDPLYPRWYGELIHASRNGKLVTRFTNETRSDAVVTSGFGEEGFANPYRKKILDALSVRYILDRPENSSSEKTFPPDTFRTIETIGDWHLIENMQAAPRIFVTTDVRTYKTRAEFENIFFSPQFNPANSVLLSEMPPLTYPVDPTPKVKLATYKTDEIILHTRSGSPAVLVVSDTYYPGWQATVDNHPAKIYRANWALRAITVPTGEHEVVMRYQPLSFAIGKLLSMISLIGLVVIIFATRKIHL